MHPDVTTELRHGLGEVPESDWRTLSGDDDVDRSHAYLRFREHVEPGRPVVLIGGDTTGLAAALHGTLTTPGTGLFSDPWKMLSREQFLRLGKESEESDAVLEEHRRLLREITASDSAGLQETLGMALTVRGFDTSEVLIRGGAAAASAGPLTATLVGAAQRHVREGLAGAVAFPFVEPGNRVLRQVLAGAGFKHAVLTATSEFDLTPYDSYEGMIASMHHQRRYTFRSERRAIEDSGFSLGTTDLARETERIVELEAANAQRYGGSPNRDALLSTRRSMADLLSGFLRVPTVRGASGEIIACGLHLADRKSYRILLYGCDYTLSDRSTAYQCINVYDPLTYAYGRGLERLRLGFEAFESKLRRGASLARRECWIWTPDERNGERLGRLLSFMGDRSEKYFADLSLRHRPL